MLYSKTQIKVGKGTMESFVEDYTTINMQKGCSVKASQLFPMDMGDKVSNTEFCMIYEYIIYFQENLLEKEQDNEPIFKAKVEQPSLKM